MHRGLISCILMIMKADFPLTVPGAEPTLLQGGPSSCLLLHGFTANPEEMQFMTDDLHRRGYTVLTMRLAGHGTRPLDLQRTHWTDWLLSVEDGLDLLSGFSKQIVLIGQSMGGVVSLIAAARLQPVAGVVALSTPYYGFHPNQILLAHLMGALGRMAPKQAIEHPELGKRREAAYPAYASYPIKIVPEIARLQIALESALPQVKVPVLVIQSHQDMGGRDDIERIYAALGSTRKEKLWLDDFDHSVVRDEKRQIVFDAVGVFLEKLA